MDPASDAVGEDSRCCLLGAGPFIGLGKNGLYASVEVSFVASFSLEEGEKLSGNFVAKEVSNASIPLRGSTGGIAFCCVDILEEEDKEEEDVVEVGADDGALVSSSASLKSVKILRSPRVLVSSSISLKLGSIFRSALRGCRVISELISPGNVSL